MTVCALPKIKNVKSPYLESWHVTNVTSEDFPGMTEHEMHKLVHVDTNSYQMYRQNSLPFGTNRPGNELPEH